MGEVTTILPNEYKTDSITRPSWWSHFVILCWKNIRLLIRSPILTTLLFTLPAIFMAATGAIDTAAIGVIQQNSVAKLLPCGSVDPIQPIYTQSQVYEYGCKSGPCKFTIANVTKNTNYMMHNGFWSAGGAVAFALVGPLINFVLMIWIMVGEASSRVIGLLRASGMRESAYWFSWLAIFSAIMFLNSLLAAAIAKIFPSIVLANTDFFPMFLTYWFFQISLIPSAFLFVIVAGRNSKLASYLGVIALLTGVIFLLIFTGGLSLGGDSPVNSGYVSYGYGMSASSVWKYYSTYGAAPGNRTSIYLNLDGQPCNFQNSDCYWVGYNTTAACSQPLVSSMFNSYGAQPTSPEDFYSGTCAVIPSVYDAVSISTNGFVKFILYLVPPFHFGRLFSIMMGATSMPNKRFTTAMMGMNTRQLMAITSPGGSLEEAESQPSLGSLLVAFGQATMDTVRSWSSSGTNCPDASYVPDLCGISYGNVARCPYVDDGPAETTSSFATTLGNLVAVTVIFMVFTLYFAHIRTAGNGPTERWYFPFTLAYWKRVFHSGEIGLSQDTCEFQSLIKEYGTARVVDDVAASMPTNEIMCLLGHNGAGKSTLIKMLTGEVRPTAGDSTVFGISVNNDGPLARCTMGLCPQDDQLYPDLSAVEQLTLFARIRGVPKNQVNAMVDEWIQDVNLEESRNNMAGSYSGGMKRRLSLAISTIGNTKLVILDEPTTGMDPVNRRFVWQHVQKIRNNRVVLLTTHAMEEADLLADSVMIMHRGKIVASGTPLELKRENGVLLEFNILTDMTKTQDVINSIHNVVKRVTDQYRIEDRSSGNIMLSFASGVNLDNEALLEPLLTILQDKEAGVMEYGICNSSLDEVFMKVTGDHGEFQAAESEPKSSCCSCCCCGSRKKKKKDQESKELEAPEVMADKLRELAGLKTRISLKAQITALLYKSAVMQWTGQRSIFPYVFLSLIAVFIVVFFCLMSDPSHSANMIVAVAPVTIVISLLLPFLSTQVAEERELRLWDLITQQGLSYWAHYISESIFSFGLSLIYALVLLVIVSQTRLATETRESLTSVTPASGNIGQVIGIAFVYALTVPGSVLILSPWFRSSRLASALIFLYSFIIPALMAVVVCIRLPGSETCQQTIKASCSSGDSDACVIASAGMTTYCVSSSVALFPPMAFPMVLSLYFNSNKVVPSGNTAVQMSNALMQSKFGEFLGIMVVGAFLWFLVGMCVSHALLFTPRWLHVLLNKLTCRVSFKRTRPSMAYDQKSCDIEQAAGEDGDLVAESERVRVALGEKQNTSILLDKLGKVYPARAGRPPKEALADFDLVVRPGDVLGLLGPNGAGKTTAIKIIAGTHDASHGSAYVMGRDIATDKVSVHENLGNCPQFDICWPSMTVKQHLEFYAQLKGLPKPKEAAVTMANGVGLGAGAYNRPAGKLSGGMRRRLSIAISLMGGPSVVLLDEPSTGLDPATRHQIWELIEMLKTPERAFIITTHMMLEADMLCNRIAIVSKGHLKAIGTQQHLKTRFGNGYSLILNLNEASTEAQEKCMDYLRSNVHPQVYLEQIQAKTLRITIPGGLNLAHAFKALFNEKAGCEGCINQWILNQSSLEDVFVNITGSDEADMSKIGFSKK